MNITDEKQRARDIEAYLKRTAFYTDYNLGEYSALMRKLKKVMPMSVKEARLTAKEKCAKDKMKRSARVKALGLRQLSPAKNVIHRMNASGENFYKVIFSIKGKRTSSHTMLSLEEAIAWRDANKPV